jgi:hypothetical protein
MSIVLEGSTSGSVTLQEPAVAGTTVLDLPATSGTVLTSASQSIPSAALPTGSVLQVVESVITGTFSTTSTSYTHATNTSLSITTSVANSKILLICNNPIQIDVGDRAQTTFRSSIDSYSANIGETLVVNEPESASGWIQTSTIQKLHSPNQAANTAITYRIYIRRQAGSNAVYFADSWGADIAFSFIAMEISA